jgi:hypothetical protein
MTTTTTRKETTAVHDSHDGEYQPESGAPTLWLIGACFLTL